MCVCVCVCVCVCMYVCAFLKYRRFSVYAPLRNTKHNSIKCIDM